MKNNNWYPWVVVGLLWVVALLNYMDRQMLSTMQEAMKIDISELNKAEAFGALMAVFLWIYGFMSPISGMIADRLNRKWLIVGSLFVWSTVTYLMGYADSFQELYWLRALMGISEALYNSISVIAYRRLASRKIQIIGHRHTHDGIICRTGSRWFRSYNRSNIFMAFHFSLVRNHRYRLLSDSHVRIKRKSGS